MDPSFVSFDSSVVNELSSRTTHYSQADISKALAILGFGSWASIEPSKQRIILGTIELYRFYLLQYQQYLKVVRRHYTYLSETDKDREGQYLKNKLDESLRKKIEDIDEKRQAEEAERIKIEKMNKKQQALYRKKKTTGEAEKKGIMKKPLFEQERDLHESYQIILSEHNKRVKQRTKQKVMMITAMMKKGTVQTTQENNDHNKDIIKETLKPWQHGTKMKKCAEDEKGKSYLSLFDSKQNAM